PVALVARRGRVDRAGALPAVRAPFRAAEDLEDLPPPRGVFAGRLHVVDLLPDDLHRRRLLVFYRRTAGDEEAEKKSRKPHASNIRLTSRPSAYCTPSMRPFMRAMSR